MPDRPIVHQIQGEVERCRTEIERLVNLIIPLDVLAYHLFPDALLDLAHRPGPHHGADPSRRGRSRRGEHE